MHGLTTFNGVGEEALGAIAGPPAGPSGPDDPSLRRTWPDLSQDGAAMRDLTEDWDGQGAAAPPLALVEGAIRLARGLQAKGYSPADRAIAGVSGTIFLEWHGPTGDYLEIEVTAPEHAEGRSVVRATG